MRLSDYYNFELEMNAYFNASHCNNSPRLKYRGEYIMGELFAKYVLEGTSTALIPKDSFLIPGERFIKWILGNDEEFINYIYSLYSSMIHLAEKLEKMNYEDMKTGKIRDKNEFYDEYTDIFSQVIGFAYPIDIALEEYAKENSIDPHSIPPFGKSFIKEEEMALHTIANEIDSIKQEELLKEHALKYSYVLSNYTGYHPASLLYFRNRISELKDKNMTEDEGLSIRKPVTIEEWIGFVTYIRDVRKKCNMTYNGMIDRYLKKECERLGLSHDDAVMLTPEEFEEQKEKGLKKYGNCRYVRATHNGFVDIDEDTWNGLITEDDKTTEIKGIVASKGKVSGIAKIIIGPSDFHKLNKGEIIVTSMTRPEFAPILSKCAAIVTNEGGITCHAAIISRELNIPCIIATGNATKLIKDGDMVEVDAEKGIVRIMK